MKRNKLLYMIVLVLNLLIIGCEKEFLDQKPDLSLAVPKTLGDCQALLDDYSRMNTGYPDHGEAAADNFYLTDEVYGGLTDVNNSPENKFNYIWHPRGEHVGQWLLGYQIIYNANLVLNTLQNISPDKSQYNEIRGSALFFRAFAFYHLAQLFCKPYSYLTSSSDLGIPLRMTPNPNEVSNRGTVQQVYDRIIADLRESLLLLPTEVKIKSRPCKAAAYAALARAYLAMEDYSNASEMSNECLNLQSILLDFNEVSDAPTATTVSSNSSAPSFSRFNVEVIFQAVTTSGILSPSTAFVYPDLYNSYDVNDRRKSVFFQSNGDNFTFRGNYDGTVNSNLFMGLATDEMYLIRAECYARSGKITLAMSDLNTLMAKRMIHPYIPRTASGTKDALVQILKERRKELIFRTIRWTDLRRLNKDPEFATTLHRDMNTIDYTPLQPNDLRYTFLIPTKEVIQFTNMEQNPR